MPASMSEYLREDMVCEGLLECFHGLKALDREIFNVLADSDQAMTVDDIAEEVDRERSTAYRSVRRLVDAGLVEKEQINYEDGGYYHVFKPVPADQIADDMQRLLNDWYAKMGQLIGTFREQYEDAATVAPSAEH